MMSLLSPPNTQSLRYTKEKIKYQPQIRVTQISSKPSKGKNLYLKAQKIQKKKFAIT